MIISSNHSLSQLQSATSAYNFIKIPMTQGAAINSTYSISAYPTIIVIKPNKQIYDQDIWPIDNSILRSTVTSAGGTPQSCIAAVEDINQASVFNVFPNPANKYLNIESGVKNETQYEIFNITGEKIISGTISNSGFKQIPLTGFSEGQYFIRLFSKENIIGVQKFIVLKD